MAGASDSDTGAPSTSSSSGRGSSSPLRTLSETCRVLADVAEPPNMKQVWGVWEEWEVWEEFSTSNASFPSGRGPSECCRHGPPSPSVTIWYRHPAGSSASPHPPPLLPPTSPPPTPVQAFDASLSVVLMKSQLEAIESKTGVQVCEGRRGEGGKMESVAEAPHEGCGGGRWSRLPKLHMLLPRACLPPPSIMLALPSPPVCSRC